MKYISTYLKNIAIAVIALMFSFCSIEPVKQKGLVQEIEIKEESHLLDEIKPIENNMVNAIIEIPAGSIEKWELNKKSGQIEWEAVKGKNRIINYLGYPGNYGFIPQTYLPKEKGGDGDPLDIIILGPPIERGTIIQCKLIGVLKLLDRGEQDDKLIGISMDAPFYQVESLSELEDSYNGVLEIIKLWFANYKGAGKMELNGLGDKEKANKVLEIAISEYKLSKE